MYWVQSLGYVGKYVYTLVHTHIHTHPFCNYYSHFSFSGRHGGLLLGSVSKDIEIAQGVQWYNIEHIKPDLELWKSNTQTFHNDPRVLA